jgi:hypothetical protein
VAGDKLLEPPATVVVRLSGFTGTRETSAGSAPTRGTAPKTAAINIIAHLIVCIFVLLFKGNPLAPAPLAQGFKLRL